MTKRRKARKKTVKLNKGKRLVTLPHQPLYQHLSLVYSDLSKVQQEQADYAKQHKISGTVSLNNIPQEYLVLMQRRAMLSSAARLYPALYLEAYINFYGTLHKLPFQSGLDRLSTARKFQYYTYAVTKRQLPQNHISFIKAAVKLRDAEVHQKAQEIIVGNEQFKDYEPYESNAMHQCTASTMLISLGRIVSKMTLLCKTIKAKMPSENYFVKTPYSKCHEAENASFRIE